MFSWLSKKPSPSQTTTATAFLLLKLPKSEHSNREAKDAVLNEGLSIVDSVEGVRVLSELHSACAITVSGTRQSLERLKVLMNERGFDLSITGDKPFVQM